MLTDAEHQQSYANDPLLVLRTALQAAGQCQGVVEPSTSFQAAFVETRLEVRLHWICS